MHAEHDRLLELLHRGNHLFELLWRAVLEVLAHRVVGTHHLRQVFEHRGVGLQLVKSGLHHFRVLHQIVVLVLFGHIWKIHGLFAGLALSGLGVGFGGRLRIGWWLSRSLR